MGLLGLSLTPTSVPPGQSPCLAGPVCPAPVPGRTGLRRLPGAPHQARGCCPPAAYSLHSLLHCSWAPIAPPGPRYDPLHPKLREWPCGCHLVFCGALLADPLHFFGFVLCPRGAIVSDLATGQGTPKIQGFKEVMWSEVVREGQRPSSNQLLSRNVSAAPSAWGGGCLLLSTQGDGEILGKG